MKSNESIRARKVKDVKIFGLFLLIGGLLIGVIISIAGSPVIDNLGMAYLRAIKPEDRGLEICNTSGFCNGTVILTIYNDSNHSVQINDVYLRDGGYETAVITSINKEIPEHSSDIIMTVQFPTGSLQANQEYSVELFTQRESYIMGYEFRALN